MRAILWKVFNSYPIKTNLPPEGRVSFSIDEDVNQDYYSACGYWVVNNFAYRVDMVERFLKELRGILRSKNHSQLNDKLSLLGIGIEQGSYVLEGLGLNIKINDGTLSIHSMMKKNKRVKITEEILNNSSFRIRLFKRSNGYM